MAAHAEGPLAGRCAIVTGGVRGLGLGIARRLHQGGARVAVWDHDLGGFDPAAAGFAPALLRQADIASPASVEAAFAATLAALGQVDILVNNAGINGPVIPAWEYPPEAWERVIAVNLVGVFHCCRAAIPHMRGRGYGRIVNIASIAGKEGVQFISGYSAAKGGVIAFSKAVAKELARDGVLINRVAPRHGGDRPAGADVGGAHRGQQGQDPDGPLPPGRGGRGHGRLDRRPRVQLHHGLHLRPHRREGHLLSRVGAARPPARGRGAAGRSWASG
jgi:3-oxoacyl-[acyl-carrier protein] reductase